MSNRDKSWLTIAILFFAGVLIFADMTSRKDIRVAYDNCMEQMVDKTPAAVNACTDKAKAIR